MDAVKFIEEAKRMCNANISNCAECCKGGHAQYVYRERIILRRNASSS